MNAVKILFILKSDCGNLSLVKLYQQFCEHGFEPIICSVSHRRGDLSCFGHIEIRDFRALNIHDFDILIITRNIFEYPISLKDIIEYQGIIISDHTTLNDGYDAYGDIILFGGRNNYDQMYNEGILLPSISVGCLKVDSGKKRVMKTNKMVWIESGHFPYGVIGRKQEASVIVDICRKFPDYKIVIKPRYLPRDCSVAIHPNADHIYYYLEKYKSELQNLILINEDCLIGDLIGDAKTVIMTYSSAIEEAVFYEAEIVNICDISTEETFQLRKNRYKRIKKYIDHADASYTIEQAMKILPHGKKVDKNIQEYYIGEVEFNDCIDVVPAILLCLEKQLEGLYLKPCWYESKEDFVFENVSRAFIYEIRLKGYLTHLVSKTEVAFDDFESFATIRRDISRMKLDWFHKMDSIEAAVNEAVKNVIDCVNRIIKCNKNKYINNKFDRAYMFKYAYENKMFENEYGSSGLYYNDEAFMYYKGKSLIDDLLYEDGKKWLIRYIDAEKGKKYPETFIDQIEYQIEAKQLCQ